MNIIIISTSDDDAVDVGIRDMFCRVDTFKLRKHLENGLPVTVITRLEVGPSAVVVMHFVELIKGGIYYSC